MCGSPSTIGFSLNLASFRVSGTINRSCCWMACAQIELSRGVSRISTPTFDLNHCRWSSTATTSRWAFCKHKPPGPPGRQKFVRVPYPESRNGRVRPREPTQHLERVRSCPAPGACHRGGQVCGGNHTSEHRVCPAFHPLPVGIHWRLSLFNVIL